MKINETLDEKIKKIKDKIAECRDYISSDFCVRCSEMYRRIDELEKVLRVLENERT
jgi:hypothetical protein